MIFSASRSRKVSIVAIIQSLAQFEKTYGKEGAEIIVDNCQCTLFRAFAPNSKTSEAMSQDLGKQTCSQRNRDALKRQGWRQPSTAND